MKKEYLGTFIDAVYAIAITILSLELVPNREEDLSVSSLLTMFAKVFIAYALAFLILFQLWIKHRTLNELQVSSNHFLNFIWALILLFINLIPALTVFSLKFGAIPGSIFQMNFSELVDFLFMMNILIIDFLQGLVVYRLASSVSTDDPNFETILRFKQRQPLITIILIVMTLATLLISFVDRKILFIVVILFIFENELHSFYDKLVNFNHLNFSHLNHVKLMGKKRILKK